MDQYLLLKCILLFLLAMRSCVTIAPNAAPSAIFVFGDSVVDPGNNNYIRSLSRANYPYNGIDFPGGPTGRFCNGRTVVDVICDIVGLPFIPAYLNPDTKGSNILRGVSYASGAGGILDASGENLFTRLPMNQQITYFRQTFDQLKDQLGQAGSMELLSKSIAWIAIGNNDFINNYLLSSTTTSRNFTPAAFNKLLIDTLARQISTLYDLGLRKFFVTAVGPVGCIPDQLAKAGRPDCIQATNDQVQDFNNGLRTLLEQLNEKLGGATLVFGNVYDSLNSLITDPRAHGFRVVNQGCCGSGLYRAQLPCEPLASLCSNRNEYVFWDAYHPTEAANIVLADWIYSGGADYISPINIQQLIDLP